MKACFFKLAMILSCICVLLFSFGCATETDVSDQSPYKEIMGKMFKTKVTCELHDVGEKHLWAKWIAIRNGDKLEYKKGSYIGIEGVNYIRDGHIFKVVQIIHHASFENSCFSVIGYFPALNKKIDMGPFFDSETGMSIISDNDFLEPVGNPQEGDR